MFGNIGPLEIIIVLIVALVVFGPKRLPELGSSLGRGIREFRDTVSGDRRDDEVQRLESPPAAAAAQAERPGEGEAVTDKRS